MCTARANHNMASYPAFCIIIIITLIAEVSGWPAVHSWPYIVNAFCNEMIIVVLVACQKSHVALIVQ